MWTALKWNLSEGEITCEIAVFTQSKKNFLFTVQIYPNMQLNRVFYIFKLNLHPACVYGIQLPPANEVCEGYVFTTCLSDILFKGGWYCSMHCRFLYTGGGIPACIAGLQAHTLGEVEGSGLGGHQAHTRGVSRPTPREVSRPRPGVGVGIAACTEASTPLPQMATAADGARPAGMHSY